MSMLIEEFIESELNMMLCMYIYGGIYHISIYIYIYTLVVNHM